MKIFLMIILGTLVQAMNAQTARISFFSEPSGAEVFLDSIFVGRTPVMQLEVPEGMHRIRFFTPSASDWNAVARSETVQVTAGEEIQKTVELGKTLTIHSVPYGAEVLLNGIELGMTPLFYRTSKTVKGEMIVRKQGFEPKAIDASMPGGMVFLKPMGGLSEPSPEIQFEEAPGSDFRRWATYSSAAAMVVSGVFAAYYKHRANNRFDSYLSTNDPAALASTDRNDRRSAIALVVTQISFVALSYLLLSE